MTKITSAGLLFFVLYLFIGCTNSETDEVIFDTDLTEYGLDTLRIKTLDHNQRDSVANVIHQNIKQDYLKQIGSDNEKRGPDHKKEEYFADKLYGYYLKFPDSKNSVTGLKRAFAGWLVSKSIDKMEVVLKETSINKSYWPELAGYYHLYHLRMRERSSIPFIDSWKQEAYIGQLLAWKNEANKEKTRTYLAFFVAETYFFGQEYKKTDGYLREVFDLNRDSVLTGCQNIVDKAQSYYNEIHSLQVGDKAPDFATTNLRGDKISLSEYRNKVILLEFWSTTCGPCIKQLPHLRKLYSSLQSRDDFVMIGISLDTDKEKVRNFINENNIDWVQIFDDGYGKISKQYNAAYIPRTYVIGKKGNIAYKNLFGEHLKNTLDSMLD